MSLWTFSIAFYFLVLSVSAQNEIFTNTSADDSLSGDSLASVIAISGQSKPKSVERIYKACGSACPPTCDEPEPDCIAFCEPGWFCPDDYYMNSLDDCVRLEDCDSGNKSTTTPTPKHLPGHTVRAPVLRVAAKVYNECGSDCPVSCVNPEERPCNKTCNPGYFCPKGFYENSRRECVRLKDCDVALVPTRAPRLRPKSGILMSTLRPLVAHSTNGLSLDSGVSPNFPQFSSPSTVLSKSLLIMRQPSPLPSLSQLNSTYYKPDIVNKETPFPKHILAQISSSNVPNYRRIVMIDRNSTVVRSAPRFNQDQSSDN